MKYKKYFQKFVKDLDKRMLKGYHDYGDKSFNLPPEKLVDELIEEVLDISGWSVILYARLVTLAEALNRHKTANFSEGIWIYCAVKSIVPH